MKIFDVIQTILIRFGTKSINLLAFLFFARMLSSSDLGMYGYVFNVIILFSSVFDFGVRNSIAHFVGVEAYSEDSLVKVGNGLWVLFVILGGSFLWCFLYFSGKFVSESNMFLPILIFFMSMLYLRMLQGVLLGRGDIGLFNKTEIVPRFCLLLAIALLFWWGSLTLVAAFWCLALSNAFGASYLFLVTRVGLRLPAVDWDIGRVLVGRGVVFMVSVMLMLASNKIALFLVSHMLGDEHAGVYFGLQRFSEIITELGLAISIVLFANSLTRSARSIKEAGRSVAKAVRLSMVLLIGLASCLLFGSDWIIPLLLGDAFGAPSEISLFRVILLGTLIGGYWVIIYPSLSTLSGPRDCVYAFIPGVTVNVLLTWLLLERYSLSGAAYALVISNTILSGIFIALFSYRSGLPIRQFFLITKADVREIFIKLTFGQYK